MTQHLFEHLSEEVWRRTIEQMVRQHHDDIIRILRRISRRADEWLGSPPMGVTAGFSLGSGPFADEGGGEGTTLYLGKTDAAIAKGGSGTVSIWTGTGGSESDSGDNLTDCFNKFADLDSGKWCVVAVINEVNYLIAGEC